MNKIAFCSTLLIVVMLLFNSCGLSEAASEYPLGESTEEGALIDKYITNTNSIELNMITADIWETTEGGYVHAIQSNGILVSMTVVFYGEMGNIQHDYYFSETSLTYTMIETSYSQPIYMQDEGFYINEVNVERYILCEGSFYMCLNDSAELLELTKADMDAFVTNFNEHFQLLHEKISS